MNEIWDEAGPEPTRKYFKGAEARSIGPALPGLFGSKSGKSHDVSRKQVLVTNQLHVREQQRQYQLLPGSSKMVAQIQ